MNRCSVSFAPRRAALLALLALQALPLAALAQIQVRNFPSKALRGQMLVQQHPLITMDGVATRLSPGARIRDANNMMVMTGALVGITTPLVVNYVIDPQGQVHEVWILTAAEAAQKRPTLAELK